MGNNLEGSSKTSELLSLAYAALDQNLGLVGKALSEARQRQYGATELLSDTVRAWDGMSALWLKGLGVLSQWDVTATIQVDGSGENVAPLVLRVPDHGLDEVQLGSAQRTSPINGLYAPQLGQEAVSAELSIDRRTLVVDVDPNKIDDAAVEALALATAAVDSAVADIAQKQEAVAVAEAAAQQNGGDPSNLVGIAQEALGKAEEALAAAQEQVALSDRLSPVPDGDYAMRISVGRNAAVTLANVQIRLDRNITA